VKRYYEEAVKKIRKSWRFDQFGEYL
jgi:hypothetical protein